LASPVTLYQNREVKMAQVVKTFYKDEKAEPPGMARHTERAELNRELREKQSTTGQKLGRLFNKAKGGVESGFGKLKKFAQDHPSNSPRGKGPALGSNNFRPDYGAFNASSPTMDPSDDYKKVRRKKATRRPNGMPDRTPTGAIDFGFVPDFGSFNTFGSMMEPPEEDAPRRPRKMTKKQREWTPSVKSHGAPRSDERYYMDYLNRF
jgi:hypothetical protein